MQYHANVENNHQGSTHETGVDWLERFCVSIRKAQLDQVKQDGGIKIVVQPSTVTQSYTPSSLMVPSYWTMLAESNWGRKTPALLPELIDCKVRLMHGLRR